MFKAFYDSVWLAPVAFWIAQAAFFAIQLRRPPRSNFFLAFTALIALDAYLNGGLSPLTSSASRTGFALLFVLIGDFRFIFLLERRAGRAAAMTLLVPLLVAPLWLLHVPEKFLWLGYEAGFFAFASVLYALRRGDRALTKFELAQYGLWIAADLVLLAGFSAGWGLRVIPNLMYYACFLPFAWSRRR